MSQDETLLEQQWQFCDSSVEQMKVAHEKLATQLI